jgi:hypothetical protein
MNAPVKILSGAALAHAIEVLEIRAQVRAYLEYEHQYEFLADAVDPLQEFAESSGLVAAIGQDEVHRLIAAPFASVRAIVAAEIGNDGEPFFELEDLTDSAADIMRRWEMAEATGGLGPISFGFGLALKLDVALLCD